MPRIALIIVALVLPVVGCSRIGFESSSNDGDTLGLGDSVGDTDVGAGGSGGDVTNGDATTLAAPGADLPATEFVDEGSDLALVITLDGPAPVGGASARWIATGLTATAGIDYSPASGIVSIVAGATSAVITIAVVSDIGSEVPETFLVALSRGVGITFNNAITLVTIRDVGGGIGVAKVVSGDDFSCGLLSDGRVKCWGADHSGQLGGDGSNIGDAPGEMGVNLPTLDLGTGLTWAALTRGQSHACAIEAPLPGRVKCWGSGGAKLGLGDGATRGDELADMGDNLPFVDLGTGRTARKVAAGSAHTCALLDNDQVKCWGVGGILGYEDGSWRGDDPADMGDNLPEVNLGSGRSVIDIASGGIHNCAVLDNGGVKCWGSNAVGRGQLGYGDTLDRGDDPGEMGDGLPYVQLGTSRTVVAIAVGEWFSCAILDNGAVKCWGDGAHGQCGSGDTVDRGDEPGEMGDLLPELDLGSGRTATQIYTNMNHACAILDGGDVKCWGSGGSKLGNESSSDIGDGPGEMGDNLGVINLGRPATALALSTGSTCALLDNGDVKCFGGGTHGVLGSGAVTSIGGAAGDMASLSPLDFGGRTAVALADGAMAGTSRHYYHCAVLNTGAVTCWGHNSGGQLGYGGLNVGDEPAETIEVVDLGLGQKASDLTAGSQRVCALLVGGSVKCWGRNGDRLGIEATDGRGDNPNEMGSFLPTVNLGTGRIALKVVAAGYDSTCAILDDYKVKCWGGNLSSALGNAGAGSRGGRSGDMGDNLPYTELGTGRRALALAGGRYHFCVLLDDATVKCWGQGNSGQLGQGNTSNYGGSNGQMGDDLPAIDLGSGSSAVAVAAAGATSCALLDDGRAKCWGAGSNGMLGSGVGGSTGNAPGEMGDALPFVDGPTFVDLFGNGYAGNICGLTGSGELRCWGNNGDGQGGQGTTGTISTPASVPAIDFGPGRIAVQVSTGRNHVCAVLDDSSLRCWGRGSFGALGLGDANSVGDGSGEMGATLSAVDIAF